MLDTSALAKVVIEEAESAALTRWLDEGAEGALLVSALAVVDLRRFAQRLALDPTVVMTLLDGLDVVPVTEPILHQAASLPQSYLRTLDAIHLATAIAVETPVIVTYDDRMARAAREEGLDVVAPA
nr:type II toxin-antitoxin system VapC family toxin [Ornithinimicrobium sp. F0845]